MWLRIRETETYTCSSWRSRIMHRCKDRRIVDIKSHSTAYPTGPKTFEDLTALKTDTTPIISLQAATTGQSIYLDWLPINTSAVEHLVTGSYNKLMAPKTSPIQEIEVLPRTITIYEHKIPSTVSMDQETLVPSAKLVERKLVYKPDEPVKKRYNRVNIGGEQTTAEELADVQRK